MPVSPLYPYQVDGAAFLSARDRAYLADDMGLGKTRQAIRALSDRLGPDAVVIVVCPLSAVGWWIHEARAMGLPAARWCGEAQPGLNVLNYDRLARERGALEHADASALVFDEAHRLKNREAVRSRAAWGLAQSVPIVWMLSGTPLPNRPAEAWMPLAILGRLPDGYEDWMTFTQRYADGHVRRIGGRRLWDVSGASNLPELADHLSPLMLRRTATEVLGDLPPHRRTLLPLSPPDDSEYPSAARDFAAWWYGQTGRDIRPSGAEALVRLGKLRQIAEIDKYRVMADGIPDDYATDSQPLLVWHHSHAVRALMHPPAAIHGGQSGAARDAVVRQFQAGEISPAWLGCQLDAGSEAITLTRAATALFLALPWTPSGFVQAEARMRRIGLDHPTRTIVPVMHPIDRAMARVLRDKSRVIHDVLEPEADPEQSILDLARVVAEEREEDQ